MKLNEIPLNTIVELQFNYMDEQFTMNVGVLYKYTDTVYISAIKSAGLIIPAKKLKNFNLIYKSDACAYLFDDLVLRSTSYCGQNLYALQSQQDAKRAMSGNANRLFVGSPVNAKILLGDSKKNLECILKNISMTGMDIICNAKLDEKAQIQISFRVKDISTEVLLGNIVNSQKFKNNDCYLYECEFDEPNIIIGSYVEKRQSELNIKPE